MSSVKAFLTISCFAMLGRAFCLAIMGAIAVSNTARSAGVIVTEAPHDESRARSSAAKSTDFAEAGLLASLIEGVAIADRSKKDRLEMLSEKQLVKLFGEATEEWKSERYARPACAPELVPFFDNTAVAILKGTSSKFFEIKGIGGLLVVFSKDGTALAPGIVYLQVDDEFKPLTAGSDLKQRAAWELAKLRQLRKSLKIEYDVTKDREGKWQVSGDKRSTRD